MKSARLTRRVLFALATSERFEDGTRSIPPISQAAFRWALRYVAGEGVEDALELARRLDGEGLRVAIDFFGERVIDPQEAEAAADAYVDLAHRIANVPEANLAIDLSHVGLDISPDFCRRQLERIIEALPTGRRLDVGAEDSARTDATHDAVIALSRVGAPIQMTLQANLRRSSADWPRLIEAGLAIRLVKGAYVERPHVAHPYGDETDIAYVRLAHALAKVGARLTIATHDAVVREALLAALGEIPVEMLLGVRSEDARALVRRGVPMRLYVPYGKGWFRYWMRRMAEAQGAV
jgi:proline dehydrogenase